MRFNRKGYRGLYMRYLLSDVISDNLGWLEQIIRE